MKTIFTSIFFATLVLLGFNGKSQCIAPNFTYSIGAAGQVTFTDYSYSYDSNGMAPVYLWSFGDGDSIQNSSFTVGHTYAHGGIYVVSLRIVVLNGGPCDSTLSETLHIDQCLGAANWDSAYLGFGDVSFTALSSSYFPGATYNWSFGDGSSSTGANSSHQYNAGGNYTVSLIVTDAIFGCADTNTVIFPLALCNFPLNIYDSIISYNPVVTEFQPSPITTGYTYSWNYGDGTTGTGSGTSHSFVSSGSFAPVLTASDAVTGCAETVSTALTINLCGVTTTMSNGGNGLTQNFYTFNYDSLNGGGTNIVSYAWSFPGATPATGTGAEVDNVVYPSIGNYSACVYITTSGGCMDTICNPVNIYPPTYSISGVATKNSGIGFAGTVYLIKQDSVGHLALIDSTSSFVSDSSTNGFGYNFGGLAVDSYYVKAALLSIDPDYASFMPTYYTSSLTWGASTPIALTGSATANIDLIAGSNPGGPGFVAGYVTQGAGLVIGGSGNGVARSVGDPLSGIQINLLTGSGTAVAYTYTDANGYYKFPSLALGTYKIAAEQLNKIPTPIEFTLTIDNPVDSSADISINSHAATGIDNVNNLQINKAYPNPVISSLQIALSSSQNTDATLKLMDVVGRTCLQQAFKVDIGENSIEINMAKLAPGVYQLVIQTGIKQITYKVVKAK